MERYICVHGHFYQPPRENPWLEAIELQDSAYPHHDWNERITAECYRPNSAARILDAQNRITQIVNNYSRISFNFGPTLLAWMEDKVPDVYAAIQRADRQSRERFSGHGSAIAQVYNHMIMPLANRRDKYTQVRWGLRDFEHRFGRKPEGMWLAETAVDLETLDILSEHGIRYTILSPYQAKRVRKRGGRKWRDATGAHIDPTRPYEQRLPSGRRMALYFYDGPISQGIAFERLLVRGEDFAQRLLGAFSNERNWPQIVHIATDGETYGHHHRHGEMALAYALEHIEQTDGVELTNYGEYLARHHSLPHVEIAEDTAWSCAHGVERWRSHCGCNTGRADWHQEWRGPLRSALDWLRDRLTPLYEEATARFLHDPWEARDEYISVILDRSDENIRQFFERYAIAALTDHEVIETLKLLELQRHAMLMYTSCGWFFDELSGIETVQVIEYAGRAVQLALELFGDASIEDEFRERLAAAKSNIPEHGDGRQIYDKWVRPAQVDLPKVAAHYATASLFEDYQDETDIYCYRITQKEYQSRESGRTRMALGRCLVTSHVTREESELSFACIHLGDHNLLGGVRPVESDSAYETMVEQVTAAFTTADVPETIRLLDEHFEGSRYTLKTLFRDEQRKILDLLLNTTVESAEAAYRHIFEQYAPLLQFLHDLGTPIPRAFRAAAESVLNADLRREILEEEIDLDRVKTLLEQANTWQAHLDDEGMSYAIRQVIEQRADLLREHPWENGRFGKLEQVVDMAHLMPFEVDLSQAQNSFYEFLREMKQNDGTAGAPALEPNAREKLKALGEKLSIRVEA